MLQAEEVALELALATLAEQPASPLALQQAAGAALASPLALARLRQYQQQGLASAILAVQRILAWEEQSLPGGPQPEE